MIGRSCFQLLRSFQRPTNASIIVTQKRSEHMLRRMHPPKLYVEGEQRLIEPEAANMLTHADIDFVHVWNQDREKYTNTGDEFVYIHEKDTTEEPIGDTQVILCWEIKGLGSPGDVVTVNRDIARHRLIPLGAALYNIPENKDKLIWLTQESEKEREQQGNTAVPESYEFVQQLLAGVTFPVPMNLAAKDPFTLTQAHLRIALRLQGALLPEKCIELPSEPVTDEEPFTFTVTLWNEGGGVHAQLPVRARVVDRLSPEARAPPAASTFKFHQRTIQESVLEAYYERNPSARRKVDVSHIRDPPHEPEEWQPIWPPGFKKKKKKKEKWVKRKC